MIYVKPQIKPSTPPITSSSLYPRLGNIALIKTLNYGITSKVKLGRDTQTSEEYAVKIIKPEYKDRYLNTVEQEAKFLSLLSRENNPNVVKLIECRPKAEYTKKNGTTKKVFALVFEFAKGGDLFECIRAIGDFREEIARTYFHQLISTVEYLHERGIIHSDLKLENLLLGEDFSLKIADFSFASFALDGNNTANQCQRLGSTNYMAPELLSNMDYNGQAIDIFSCGVILFMMVVGHPPFEKAANQDLKYKWIIKQQYQMFWKMFETKDRPFSSGFKELINSLLSFESTQRLTISEIKSHPWYLGKTCSVEELKKEYEAKEHMFLSCQEQKANQLKKTKEANALKKKEIESGILKPKLNALCQRGITPVLRSLSSEIEQQIRERLKGAGMERIAREYIFTNYKQLSEHFYNISQEIMFKLILMLSDSLFNTYKMYSAEYKIKGRVISETADFTGEILINITHVDEFSCCLGITKVKGPLLPFYKYIESKLKVTIDKAIEQYVKTD